MKNFWGYLGEGGRRGFRIPMAPLRDAEENVEKFSGFLKEISHFSSNLQHVNLYEVLNPKNLYFA